MTQVSGKEDCRGEGGISPGLEVTQWLECGPRGSVHIRHMGTTGSAAIVGGVGLCSTKPMELSLWPVERIRNSSMQKAVLLVWLPALCLQVSVCFL